MSLGLIVIIAINALEVAFATHSLYPLRFTDKALFISELLGQPIYLPFWFKISLNFGNIYLFWLISRQFLKSWSQFIAPTIYALAPWSIYLVVTNSIYIAFLTPILLFIYGLQLVRDQRYQAGRVVVLIGSVILAYSSPLLFLVMTLAIFSLVLFKSIPLKIGKFIIIGFILATLPLIIIGLINFSSLRNVLRNDVRLFTDPGYLNATNNFQGQSQKAGFGFLAKLSENKYEYLSKYFLAAIFQNLTPATLFTPQAKLLGFGFAPPLYLGWLIPFLLGLYQVFQNRSVAKLLFVSLLLIIPSLLSQNMLDLNRLSLLLPVVIFLITLGLIKLKPRLLIICLTLVLIQIIFTIFDTPAHEFTRHEVYFGITQTSLGSQ